MTYDAGYKIFDNYIFIFIPIIVTKHYILLYSILIG
jgi:hypothetical protein